MGERPTEPAPTMPETTVYVIDDDQGVADALVSLLRSHGWSAQAWTDATAFLQRNTRAWPACALVDVRMSPIDGLELQCRLKLQEPNLPIIFITAHGDIPLAVKAVKAGAIDFLTKPVDEEGVLKVLRHAEHVARTTRPEPVELSRLWERWQSLTERETKVVELVCAGWRQRDIGQALCISEATVKVHRRHAADKLNAHSLTEMVAFVQRIHALS